MSIRCVVNPRYQVLEPFVKGLHASFHKGGTLLFNRRNVIKRFDAEGHTVVVKCFHTPMIVQRLVYSFFRKSKAERAYINALELQKRAFSTPESIAFAEVKNHGLLAQSYFVCTETILPPIEDRLDRSDFDKSLAQAFARFVARLHEQGILHHDLNDTNVLFSEEGEAFSFTLIDCNRMTFYPSDTCPPLDECMENLTRFTGDYTLFRLVAECYCKERGLEPAVVDRLMAVKKRHDERWRRRKAFFRHFKRKKS